MRRWEFAFQTNEQVEHSFLAKPAVFGPKRGFLALRNGVSWERFGVSFERDGVSWERRGGAFERCAGSWVRDGGSLVPAARLC